MNEKTNNRVLTWCLIGFITLVALGVILHYVYQWTNESRFIGLIVPVNESVWEHLKLGYWALIIFSVVEYSYLKDHVNSYFLAKLLGFLVMTLTIPFVFYSYTYITGHSILWIDIASYVLGAMLCQLLSYIIYRAEPKKKTNAISLVLFIGIGVLFALLTHFPPHIEVFIDSTTNTYGINKEK